MNTVSTSEYLKNNYEDYYQEGDSEWRRLGAIGKAANIVALCHDLPRRRVLEIGAGEGSILKRLSELGFAEELYALEISSSGAETIAKREISQLVECKVFDGSHVPYDDDKFDLAILSHVVEHLEHPRQLIYEATRVAKYVFIEVPLQDTMRQPVDFVFDKVGHINFYSSKTIRRLVQSCNLRVLRQIVTNPPREAYAYSKGTRGTIDYFIKELLLKLSSRAATKVFSYHCALICDKANR